MSIPDRSSATIHRVFRYRLYPSAAQESELERQLELCRRLYNKALWWRQGDYDRSSIRVTRKEQTHALVDLKEWEPLYREISPGVLEDVIKRVDLAFRAFFRRCKAGEKPGYPRSKGLGWYKSITVPRSREFKLEWGPGGTGKVGYLSFKGLKDIRVRMHRALPEGASVRRVMVKREANGHWYALFGWDADHVPPEHTGSPTGLDVGLSAFVTSDQGEKVLPPRNYKRLQRKLRRKQRVLSRRKRGSNRRKRAREAVARVHAKIRNRRRDFLHNVSRRIVNGEGFGSRGASVTKRSGLPQACGANADEAKRLRETLCPPSLIALEDLRINNLSKNHHLAGSILDAGWGEFASMLSYKAESAGSRVVFVDPRNTSQMCSACGALPEKPKALSERIHRCSCGLVLDRDHNAARNILRIGLCEPSGA